MTRDDVFCITVNTELRKVVYEMIDGSIKVLLLSKEELKQARKITYHNGAVAGTDEYVRLYNEKH